MVCVAEVSACGADETTCCGGVGYDAVFVVRAAEGGEVYIEAFECGVSCGMRLRWESKQ